MKKSQFNPLGLRKASHCYDNSLLKIYADFWYNPETSHVYLGINADPLPGYKKVIELPRLESDKRTRTWLRRCVLFTKRALSTGEYEKLSQI